ncbi:hypothetical protein FACS1894123_02770 [Bacteroidia bacterium]|nr:hypothetical protein FACS1894123_02770 [Bacteroidia bacterium]
MPVEFPLVADGHRPASEYFRNESDQLLLRTYQELGLHPFVVHGSMCDRLDMIVDKLNINKIMSIKQAVELACAHKKNKMDSIHK